jgi:hypothetical protein
MNGGSPASKRDASNRGTHGTAHKACCTTRPIIQHLFSSLIHDPDFKNKKILILIEFFFGKEMN